MYMKILKQKEEVDRQKLRAYGLDLFSMKFKNKMQKVSYSNPRTFTPTVYYLVETSWPPRNLQSIP